MAKIFTKDFYDNLVSTIAKDIAKRDYDKALSNIEIALKLKAAPELYHYLTLAYKAKNMIPEALQAIECAIKLNPQKEYLKEKTDLNYLLRIKTVKKEPVSSLRTAGPKNEELEAKKIAKVWGEIWDENPAEIEHFYTLFLKGREAEAKKALKALLASYYEGDDLDYNLEKLYKLPISQLMVKKLGERAFSIADFHLAAVCFSHLATSESSHKESYKKYLENPKLKEIVEKNVKPFIAGDYVCHNIKRYTGQILSFSRDSGLCEIITNKKVADSKLYDKTQTAHFLNLKKIEVQAISYCWNCFEFVSELPI
jgi:tetratricopeptide (TPR) repeat protein